MKVFLVYLDCPMRARQLVAQFPTIEQAQECLNRKKPQYQEEAEAAYGKGDFSTYGRGWKLYIEASENA